MTENILMNEEEIRGKLLLPYLENLGFDTSEIVLEKSFSIRLGKTQHTISGRSDILCTRNGKNLFIIELKRDSIPIKDEDIQQGISYAKQLKGNIAPFTIITNGKTTRIFDSITEQEITGVKLSEQSSFWRNGCTLATEEDLRIRYEALKNFIGFSAENLQHFCSSQVKDRMGPLVGEINHPSSKYVKELFVQRPGLLTAFNNFLNSENKIFGIIGAAGSGKTNVMCSLALQNLVDKFVFFYNAALLTKSPLEHIAQDLNGVFSSRNESDVVLKKLDDLGRFLNRDILIFIDAIDESADPNFSLELSEMALAARNLDKIKICISCKTSIWKSFLIPGDIKTHLYEELMKYHSPISTVQNCPAFLLEDFSDDEIKNVLPLYKNVFKFKGHISEKLHKELKNGFFLRIFSEVYSGRQVPEKINDRELIKIYVKQSLEKTKIGFEKGVRILAKIGEVSLNNSYSSLQAYKDDGVNAEDLLDKLNFSFDENLPEDLFSRNLLIRSNKDDSYNVAFYYSKIRDYIICFHTYKLDKLTNTALYNILSNFYVNHIGQSAIKFYIENASYEHRKIIAQFKEEQALKYVEGYSIFINENFKNFKNLFDPETDGEIGIILPKEHLENDGYALFPMESNSKNKVSFENLHSPFSDPSEPNLFLEIGVQSVYGSNASIMVSDQSGIIRQNIFKQLKEIIKKGKLRAYNSDILFFETISAILYQYYEKLDYEFNLDDYYLPRFESLYPIDLKSLQTRLYKAKARIYYEDQYPRPKNIEELVNKALEDELFLPDLNYRGDVFPAEELYKIVNLLIAKGIFEIKEHFLPTPDKTVAEAKIFHEQNAKFNLRLTRPAQYSEEQANIYIETFFKLLECCYKDFVEYCFPTIKDEFKFYNSMPHEYNFYMKDLDLREWGLFGYQSSDSGKVEIVIKEYDFHHKIFAENKGIKSLQSFSLDMLLYSRDPVKTIDRINLKKVDEYCVLRNWVHRILMKDLEDLFKLYEN